MDVTIAICTWNRARLLDKALEALQLLEVPSGLNWEVLVVDNNSTDDTANVVSQHEDCLPVRSVLERQQGKTYALNTAVDAINSELILWMDDDVLVEPGWLSSYVDVAERSPDVCFWGGAVEPCFEESPPTWITRAWNEVANAFVYLDPSEFGEEIGKSSHGFPMGANWAVRTAVQRKYRYSVNLGPKGGELLYGDETAVMQRMLNDNVRGEWCPQAKVRHFNQKERSTESYLRRYFYGVGRSHFRFLEATSDKVSVRNIKPPELYFGELTAEMKYRLGRYAMSPEYWVRNLRKSSQTWGLLASYREYVRSDSWIGGQEPT